INL
ncbi:Toluene efflux pump outer membrane protein TtgC precursor, partial [Haemophilus influenzae]